MALKCYFARDPGHIRVEHWAEDGADTSYLKVQMFGMHQQKPFILVVEDDGPLRKVLTRYLQAIGYFVLEAASFREAVDQIAIKPNLVILDINLPDATGWDVAEWLQSVTEDVPIIMISASTHPGPKQLLKVGRKRFLR